MCKYDLAQAASPVAWRSDLFLHGPDLAITLLVRDAMWYVI